MRRWSPRPKSTLLTRWLVDNAAQGKRASEMPAQARITKAAWFQRKHRKIDAAVFSRASIGGASQCQACHRDAAAGDFDDDRVRIPR